MDNSGGLQIDDDEIADNDFPNYGGNQFYRSNDFHSEYISIQIERKFKYHLSFRI